MKNQRDGGATADKDKGARTTTTVGPTITIRGRLSSGEDLIVKGRIDAEITSSKALLIENSGVVRANVNVESARVSGILLGDLTAADKIEIASDGRMIGDMMAPRIVVHDGAAFRGRIDMPNFDGAGQATGGPAGAPGEPGEPATGGAGVGDGDATVSDAGGGYAAVEEYVAAGEGYGAAAEPAGVDVLDETGGGASVTDGTPAPVSEEGSGSSGSRRFFRRDKKKR